MSVGAGDFQITRRNRMFDCDWSSDVCSADLIVEFFRDFLADNKLSISTLGALRSGRIRSEERRVGNEWRCRWAPETFKSHGGIGCLTVTGVQTCALPISSWNSFGTSSQTISFRSVR